MFQFNPDELASLIAYTQQGAAQKTTTTTFSFKAGLLSVANGKATPDPRRGQVVIEGDSRSIRVKYLIRPTDVEEWALNLLPNEASFVLKSEIKAARVFHLKYANTSLQATHDKHFWLQEVDPALDADILSKCNAILCPPKPQLAAGTNSTGQNLLASLLNANKTGFQTNTSRFLHPAVPPMSLTSTLNMTKALEQLDEADLADLTQFLPEGQQSVAELKSQLRGADVRGAIKYLEEGVKSHYPTVMSAIDVQPTQGTHGVRGLLTSIVNEAKTKAQTTEKGTSDTNMTDTNMTDTNMTDSDTSDK